MKDTIKELFNHKGRQPRFKFFTTNIILGMTAYLCAAIIIEIPYDLSVLMAFLTLALVFVMLMSIIATVINGIKRLHDLNQSGWLYIIAMIPYIGSLFGLFLLFWKGTTGKNDYGSDQLK